MNRNAKLLLSGLALCVLGAGLYLPAQFAPRSDLTARFHESLAHEAKGEYTAALESLAGLTPDERSSYLIELRTGWLYYLSGNYPQSVEHYTRAAERSNRTSIEALLGLRLPLAAMNDWSAVEQVYRDILRLDSRHYEANLRLGQIFLNRGDYAGAKPYLDTVRTAYPADYEANLSSGWNYFYLQDPSVSRRCFETALMLSPGDTSATRGLQQVR